MPSLEPEPVAADSADEEAPASRFPRWIPIAAAAAVVLGIGGTLWFTVLAPQTTPSETTEVAAVPTNTTATPKKAPTPIVRKPVLNPDSVPPDLGVSNPNNTPVDPTPTTGSNPEVTPADPNVQPADPSNPTPSGNGESMDPTKANDPAGTGANTPANQPTNPNDTPPVEKVGQPVMGSLARGTDVIVRLRNGNLFNGKLDRFTPEEARLRVPKGIIEFSVRDVDAIVPLSQASKKAGPQAVIQLLNGNKLAGRLTDDTADQVTLAVGAAEIIVPKNAIASLELRSPLGLVLGDEPPKPAPTPK